MIGPHKTNILGSFVFALAILILPPGRQQDVGSPDRREGNKFLLTGPADLRSYKGPKARAPFL
jgi:hypothetical protein